MAIATFSPAGSAVWRDYATDGVPASGVHRPNKSDIRTWAGLVEGAFVTLQGLGIGTTGTVGDVSDLDSIAKNSGWYSTSASTTGTWPTGVAAAAGVLEYKRSSAILIVETLYLLGAARAFWRRYTGSWSAWVEVNTAEDAGDLPFTPTGDNAATDVQTAIENSDTATVAAQAAADAAQSDVDDINAAVTAAGWALLDDADAAAMRVTLSALYAPATAVTGDLNDLTLSGVYRLSSPSANGWGSMSDGDMLLNMVWGTGNVVQLGVDINATTTPLHLRRKISGVWEGSWKSFYTKSDLDALLVGVSQTYQDVAASRAVNTSYQNTTGKPIWVLATTAGGGNDKWQVSNDGSTWYSIANASGNGDNQHAQFPIPNGCYYRINGTTATITTWIELR